MAKFLDVARFTPTAGGTTDWTVSAAVTGYQTPVAAGAVDGINYRYRAESADLSQWEIGYGVASSTGTVFARTTVLFNSSGTTSKINFSVAPTVGIVPLAEDFREKLDANRTYYVRTDGSDSNTGLANTAGGAFLTIQKAINVAATLDFNAFTVTVTVGAGTFTGVNVLKLNVGQASTAGFTINGAGATTIISTTSNDCFAAAAPGITAKLSNMKLQTTTSGFCINLSSAASLQISGIEFGACANYHMLVQGSGTTLSISGNYTISGGATFHIQATSGAYVQAESAGTITLTGTPAFSTFAYCENASNIRINGNTYSGAATGIRYAAVGNGVIFVNGAGATYLPGGTAGSTSTGGQYI